MLRIEKRFSHKKTAKEVVPSWDDVRVLGTNQKGLGIEVVGSVAKR